MNREDYGKTIIDLLFKNADNNIINNNNSNNTLDVLLSDDIVTINEDNSSSLLRLVGNDYCRNDMPGLYLIVQLLYIVVCISGLLGNTLVIYVVLRFSKMQTVTNMYIVNLAIADECFLIGIPFLLVTMNMQSWPFGEVLCKLYMASTSINQFTSSIFLLIMSADRYIAVCHPISAPAFRTPFISKLVSLSAWTLSAVLMIPVLMYSNTMTDEHNNHTLSCNILWPDEERISGHAAFTLYSSVLGFVIPLLLIFVFYSLVIRKLRTVGPKSKSKEKKKSHRKVTRLVLTVVTVYVCCWLPYWVTQLSLIFTPAKQCQTKFNVIVFLITGCLSYSNSAMNPILYAFLSDNFKKSFLKACTCATGKDVNATLHLENSVFPKKNKNNRKKYYQRRRLSSIGGAAVSGTSLKMNKLQHRQQGKNQDDTTSDNGSNNNAIVNTADRMMTTTTTATITSIIYREDDNDDEDNFEEQPLVDNTDTAVATITCGFRNTNNIDNQNITTTTTTTTITSRMINRRNGNISSSDSSSASSSPKPIKNGVAQMDNYRHLQTDL